MKGVAAEVEDYNWAGYMVEVWPSLAAHRAVMSLERDYMKVVGAVAEVEVPDYNLAGCMVEEWLVGHKVVE